MLEKQPIEERTRLPQKIGTKEVLILALFCSMLALTFFLSGNVRYAPDPEGTGNLRLVSTAPNLTECVFAVGAGDLLVGRTDACNYPAEAVSRIPITGGFATPYIEPLLSVRPTHVLETALADPDFRRRFDALHIPVVHVPCVRLDDVPAAIHQVGILTGHTQEAERIAARIRSGVEKARSAAALQRDPPRVLLLFDGDSLITAGKRSFVSELLRLAGGVSLGDDTGADYYHLSLEWLLKQDPDIILCLFETSVDEPVTLLEKQTGWSALSAVRQRRVYTVPDLDTVCRPGPRLLEGLAQLKNVLSADAQRHSSGAGTISPSPLRKR